MTFPIIPASTVSGGYRISRSLRFRSSASAYLSRTPASAGNGTTWTWSGWVKRGTVGAGSAQYLFSAGTGTTDTTAFGVRFNSTDSLAITSYTTDYRVTNAIFRDPSAWYHIVFVLDTTNATANNRAIIYVNGVAQTYSTNNTITQSTSYPINNNVSHSVGRWNQGAVSYFDGYLAEVNFIDGQALTPSSFGAFDSNGIWQPAKYTGSYGTNGFYIPFTDTTGSVGGNDTYAKILLHGDGANNSTSILDSSWSNRKTFTAAGGAKISTTQSKFGGSSIYFDGANNTAVTCPSNADLNPSGDFTIDCWVYFTSSSSQQAVVIKTDAGGVSPYLIYTSGTSLIYYASSNNSSWDIFSGTSFGTFSLNTWTHIAIVRSGNTYYGFVNGVRTTLGTSSLTPTAQTTTFRLGHYTSTLGVMSGYIDEFRFSNGIARWTADFSSSLPTRYTGYIGADTSGNYNDWDAYNISTSSGTTYDSMIDSPTNYADGGNGRGNYAVLNPVAHPATFIAPTDGNLSQNCNTSAWTLCVATLQIPDGSGLWQWELVQTGTANGANAFGVALSTVQASVTGDPGSRAGCSGVNNSSGAFINGATSGSITYPTVGDTVTCLYDATNRTFQVFDNGTSKGTITGLPAGDVQPFVAASSSNGSPTFVLNFGQRPFSYDKGGKALNTQNLPTPTIAAGNKYFDATTYTGNSSTQSITNSGSFQPDLVWIKNKSISSQHVLTDGVRGTNYQLFSSLTNAEQNSSTGITAFNSNGFSLGSNVSPTGDTNSSPNSFIAWQWNAGGSTVSNTSGSITSSVRANTSAGFSITQFTASGSNATIGHGLGVAPSMVIVKDAASAGNWAVWHSGLTSGSYYLFMNTTAAQANTSSIFTAAPTSTVVSIGTWHTADRQIMYCFAPVAGYSAFGSYSGNGSTDGPFIYTGFRPRWILLKNSAGTADVWTIVDTSRDTYNTTQNYLQPNASSAEATYAGWLILSNGFKLVNTGTALNASGSTYIYAAFAENPFKYSRAR